MKNRNRRGFSLIELLVAIAIIATLMGLLLPAIQKIRIAFRRLESANNLKQISLATLTLHENIGMLPPPCGWNNKDNVAVEGGVNGTPFFMILPYMDQQNLFNKLYGRLPADCPQDSPHYSPLEYAGVPAYRANLPLPRGIGNAQPKQFTTILDKSNFYFSWKTSYLANNTLLKQRLTLNQITDGTSNTVLYAEGAANCGGGALYCGTADYGSQYNFNDGSSSAQMQNITPQFDPYINLAYDSNFNQPALFWIDGFENTSRENNWLAGSELVDFEPQDQHFKSPNNSLLVKSTAYPILPAKSDFNVLPFKIVKEKRELQTTTYSRRSQNNDCYDYPLDYPYIFEDNGSVMGNIPVFYNVPGYSFQDPMIGSPEIQTLTFQDSGNGSGTFQIAIYGGNNYWSTPNIHYSSDPTVLAQNIQVAVNAVLDPNASFANGTDIQAIKLCLAQKYAGYYFLIGSSWNLKGVTVFMYESQKGYAGGDNGTNAICDWFSPQVFSGTLHVAMVDGSVRGLSSGMSANTWNAAVTPNGGEVLGSDFFE